MRINTSLDGWEAVFFPWQMDAINAIYKYPEGVTSKTVHMEVANISRASCINFLEELWKEGLVNKRERSGKGGMHGVYSPIATKKDFLDIVLKKFSDKINTIRTGSF